MKPCNFRPNALAALFFALTSLAQAQSYPSKPLHLIVPYPPGGGTDIVARAVAQKLFENTGQPMVIENKPGASELIGTDALAKSAPDGYTMGLVTNTFSINESLQHKLPYNGMNDFSPVTMLVATPFAIAVNPSVPAQTLQELVALARSKPGSLNYASLGPGSIHQLSMEWFKHLARVDIVAIPYKGLAAALTAGIAGEVQVVITGLTAGMTHIKSGKLRALAVTTAKRTPAAPDIPAVAETGFPDYDVMTWYGILLPAATPPDIVAKLGTELTKALNAPEVKERFKTIGVDTAPMSPTAFADFLRSDIQLWARIVKLTGAKPE